MIYSVTATFPAFESLISADYIAQKLAKTLKNDGFTGVEIRLNVKHSVYNCMPSEELFGVLSPEGFDTGEGFDTREEAEKIAAQFDRELIEDLNAGTLSE